MNIDAGLLQTFVTVHRHQGFTRAADQLHLTQSAVSHQIRRLEALVGRPLFRRTTRRLSLTADGEDLLHHAPARAAGAGSAGAAFPLLAIEGTVRLGVMENFMSDACRSCCTSSPAAARMSAWR